MESLKTLFGKKIRELRKKNNYTQAKLAEMVNVDDKHISCIEAGKNFPSPDLIERLSIAFQVEPKDFFEFYHLEEAENLKKSIATMLEKLGHDDLILAHKYVRTFLLK